MTREIYITAFAALVLSACSPDRSPEGEDANVVRQKLVAGQVVLWATAPDGVRLWATIGRDGRTVYFSSSGVQSSHTEVCGNRCSRTVDDVVPSTR